MSVQVPPRLVEKAARRFELESRRRTQAVPPPSPRVITISRQLGSGGRRIAEILGGWLHWPVWDKAILDVIASQSHLRYQARMFEFLDERAQSSIDALAYSLLGDVNKHIYLHLLPRAVLLIAQNDAILLGRGAHLLLPEAFKVRVVASFETRVRNLIRFEGSNEEAARKRIRVSDQEREAFLQELAGRLGRRRSEEDRDSEYDLTVNTDRFDVHEAASMILGAARLVFDLAEPPTSRGGQLDATALADAIY